MCRLVIEAFQRPFDCNCYYADGHSMMDFFRVFCFTPPADNIFNSGLITPIATQAAS